MTPADTMRAAVEALEETRRVDEFGRQPEAHWESLRDMRRSVIEKQDAALSLLRSALEQGEPEPVAYIWHQHMGEETKSLRWTKPTQWDYTTRVEPLYLASIPPNTPVEAGKVGVASGVDLPDGGQRG